MNEFEFEDYMTEDYQIFISKPLEQLARETNVSLETLEQIKQNAPIDYDIRDLVKVAIALKIRIANLFSLSSYYRIKGLKNSLLSHKGFWDKMSTKFNGDKDAVDNVEEINIEKVLQIDKSMFIYKEVFMHNITHEKIEFLFVDCPTLDRPIPLGYIIVSSD